MLIKPTVKLTEMGDNSLQEGTADLRRIEKAVNDSDRAGLHARWESGRRMRAFRSGKQQLPNGLRVFLMDELKLNRSEITARMKFAKKYPEEQLTDVIGKFGTWYAITHKALTGSVWWSVPSPTRGS